MTPTEFATQVAAAVRRLFDPLAAQVGLLSGRTAQLEAWRGEVVPGIARAATAVTAVDALGDGLGRLEADVRDVRDGVAAVPDAIGAATEIVITKARSEIAAIETRTAANERAVAALDADRGRVDAQVRALGEEIEHRAAEWESTVGERIAVIAADLDASVHAAAAIRSEVEALQRSSRETGEQVTAMTNDGKARDATLGQLAERVELLVADVASIAGRTGADITALRTACDELRALAGGYEPALSSVQQRFEELSTATNERFTAVIAGTDQLLESAIAALNVTVSGHADAIERARSHADDVAKLAEGRVTALVESKHNDSVTLTTELSAQLASIESSLTFAIAELRGASTACAGAIEELRASVRESEARTLATIDAKREQDAGTVNAVVASAEQRMGNKIAEVVERIVELDEKTREFVADHVADACASVRSSVETGTTAGLQQLTAALAEVEREVTALARANDDRDQRDEGFTDSYESLSAAVAMLQKRVQEHHDSTSAAVATHDALAREVGDLADRCRALNETVGAMRHDVEVAKMRPLIKGDPGRDGVFHAPVGWSLKAWPQNSMVRHFGGLWWSYRDTDAEPGSEGDTGWTVVADGVRDVFITQGASPLDFEISVRQSSGAVVSHALHVPDIEFRGVWLDREQYEKNQLAVRKGTLWIAKRANKGVMPGTPDGADDWHIAAKAGIDGKPGTNALAWNWCGQYELGREYNMSDVVRAGLTLYIAKRITKRVPGDGDDWDIVLSLEGLQ